ncbi:hypothetical protein K4K57_000984 [Colletotrichum sp. SAR 10_99]|nr:hypothetical protein K4K55_003642 [Colletotrichum sp. SAR 10_96]KAJ5019354.1 hypothetical protein K4K57_000984 [Colletotrichum sp. SAR 10_99]
MSFPLVMRARRLSKAALDDLIRETKANEIKASEYSNLLYTAKKTKVKFHLEIDMEMVEATDNIPDACEYLTSFLEIAKAA